VGFKSKYIQPGDYINFTPGADLAGGDIIVTGGLIGGVDQAIASGNLGALNIEAVRECAKVASVAFSVGDHVFWDEDGTPSGGDPGTGCCVNWVTAISSGARYLGKCVVAALAADTTVRVLLAPEATSPIRTVSIAIEDLAAGADFTARPLFNPPWPCQLVRAGILTLGAPAGVDDSNTAVIALTDGAGNSIVSKTYNTAAQPPSGAYGSLGALDATNSLLTADELVKIAVTQGTTANLPGFFVVLDYMALL